MFENPALFLKIFAEIAAIAMIVYRFQLFNLIYKVIFKSGKKDNSVEQKVNEYLEKHKTKKKTYDKK